MKVKMSYMVKFTNGTSAWFRAGTEAPTRDVESTEERPVLVADAGKMLRNKETGEICENIWLRDTTEEDYEEITREEAEEIMDKQRREFEAEITEK